MQLNVLRSLLVLFSLGGCAAQSASPRGNSPATRPSAGRAAAPLRLTATDPKAGLTLGEIQPRPAFPSTAVETRPSEPPLESLRLFAKARIAILDGDRGQASQLLEQAAVLDAGSFQLHKSLGDLYASASDSRAGKEWEKAAALEPDHLDLQIDLGRRAVEEGELANGMQHLRLALLTADYRRDDPADGEADFLLARALQDQGYDRAALETYERLLARLRGAKFAARLNPQIAALLSRPDVLALHVAALYEKNRSYAPALSLLRSVSGHVPANFDLPARIIRDEAAAGERRKASEDAAGLVGQFHANSNSVKLLSEVAGGDAVRLLQKLHESDPVDRDLTYALADILMSRDRLGDAGKVLDDAARRWPDDPRLLRRQLDLSRSKSDIKGAARLAIEAFSRRPDHQIELTPLWDSLSHASPHGKLRVADVQAISVVPESEPARLVLLARLAEVRHRDGVEREALEKAVNVRPAFAPAFRELLALIWADEGRAKQRRIDDSRDLASDAERAGDHSLAAELRGQALLNLGEAQPASTEFAAAVKAGNRSSELYVNFAAALHDIGDDKGAQALLWKVIGDRPLATEAYEELYAIYQKRQEPERAKGVLRVWLTADPDSVAAQQLQVREAFEQRRFTDAGHILMGLLARRDADPRVLGSVVQFYAETGRLKELAPILSQRLASEKWNTALALSLSEAYGQEHLRQEALRVLDGLRPTVWNDADDLYALAGAYSRMNENARSEQALTQVVMLDPSFAGANNDLGYSWAEQGKNLTQAEAMVARALRAEPDNPSFLDSMGWVLYKLGKFNDAVKDLEKAAAGAEPVVLDHLGDALYRLGDQNKAAAEWKQAASAIGEPRADERAEVMELRKKLREKQQQLAGGQTVSVAPVVEEK